MQVVKSQAFDRTYKKLLKRKAISSKEFNKVINEFVDDHTKSTLHFKKIICKHDKNRHSIRVKHLWQNLLNCFFLLLSYSNLRLEIPLSNSTISAFNVFRWSIGGTILQFSTIRIF